MRAVDGANPAALVLCFLGGVVAQTASGLGCRAERHGLGGDPCPTEWDQPPSPATYVVQDSADPALIGGTVEVIAPSGPDVNSYRQLVLTYVDPDFGEVQVTYHW